MSESTVEGISRIPCGQSLFLGGFYDSSSKKSSRKVPVLGAIPLLGNLFKSRGTSNEQVSLVFIITPTVYDASSVSASQETSKRIRTNSGFNRTNPAGLGTPLLPEADPSNDNLPCLTTAPPPARARNPRAASSSKPELQGWCPGNYPPPRRCS